MPSWEQVAQVFICILKRCLDFFSFFTSSTFFSQKGTDLLHNIEEGVAGIYRMGDYKLISGNPGDLSGWYFQNGSSETDDSFVYTGTEDYYLFDLKGIFFNSYMSI